MNDKDMINISEDIKYLGTGSAPYYLNINITTKDFSNQELTNPSNGLLDMLNKQLIIEDNIQIISPLIYNNSIIVDR